MAQVLSPVHPKSSSPPPPKNNNDKDWASSFFKQADMGRRYKTAEYITGPFARTLISKTNLLDPPSSDEEDKLNILDNACGGGVVAAALHDMLDPATKARMELLCGDFSEPMLQAARERIEENGWEPNTRTELVDCEDTKLPPSTFTHVLANFVIMGLQNPDAALSVTRIPTKKECHRILLPHGTLAFTTWHLAPWIPHVRAAFATLPGPPPFPDDLTMYRSWGDGGDWHSPDWIRSHLTSSPHHQPNIQQHQKQNYNFEILGIDTVAKELVIESPAAFADTFSVMIPVIVKRFWSEREREEVRLEAAVEALRRYMEGVFGVGGE
ncbi:MAG: hypothetical protein Q9219_006817, partial [cf. Caloplaca sp. 3 TL-2023]